MATDKKRKSILSGTGLELDEIVDGFIVYHEIGETLKLLRPRPEEAYEYGAIYHVDPADLAGTHTSFRVIGALNTFRYQYKFYLEIPASWITSAKLTISPVHYPGPVFYYEWEKPDSPIVPQLVEDMIKIRDNPFGFWRPIEWRGKRVLAGMERRIDGIPLTPGYCPQTLEFVVMSGDSYMSFAEAAFDSTEMVHVIHNELRRVE